jgi:hypothetical protein
VRERGFLFLKNCFSVKVNALCAQRMRGGSQLFHFFDGLLNALGLFSKRKKKNQGVTTISFFSLSLLSIHPSSDSPPAPLWPRSPFVARLFFLQGFFSSSSSYQAASKPFSHLFLKKYISIRKRFFFFLFFFLYIYFH